jgi:hypothetical protein
MKLKIKFRTDDRKAGVFAVCSEYDEQQIDGVIGVRQEKWVGEPNKIIITLFADDCEIEQGDQK